MYRDMRRVGDQAAARVEDGAGEIEPLLDIDRARGVLQRIAHLLGDRHEQIVEHFEHDGIGMLADARVLALDDAGEQQMVARRDLRLPFRLDHDGLMVLDDERWAGDASARR